MITSFTKSASSRFFVVPVKFTNPRNNKSVSVNLDVDTAGYNTIPPKYADTLGLSSEYSVSSFESYGQDIEHHELIAQIGSLKPVKMITRISTQSFGSGNGVLGWANNGLSNWIVDFIGSKMTLTEYNDPNANAVPTGRYIELPLKTSTEFSKPVSGDYPCHDVKFYKRNSDKSITLKTLFDTGVKNTTLPKKNARMLGISDIEEGGVLSTSPAIFKGNTPVEYYSHPIDVQVGNLSKVRNVMTRFSDFWNEAILGPDVIFKYKIRLTKNKIRYEELVPPTTASVKAQSAYLIAHNYYTLGTRTGRNYRL